MKIEIWSDVICPFCYIGKRKLELALEQVGATAAIEWHSFELNPHAPASYGFQLPVLLQRMYGMPEQRAIGVLNFEKEEAAAVGLTFNWEQAQPGNTFLAHRMIHLAKEHGLGDQAKEAYLKAYFSDGREIGNPSVVADIAVAVGLPQAEVDSVLNSDRFAAQVRADQAQAQALGIRGVPYFVINGKTVISGAVAIEQFVATLKQAMASEAASNLDGDSCADGICAVK